MKFENSYFEDEVRDGFYVPGMMKRCWAAELEVLAEINRICKKHHISYTADWGTLLGTVRHGGFIPWDDDIDLCMLRADYQRFMKVASKELKGTFEVYTYRENEEYWGFVTRVVAKRQICFEAEHLEKFHEFPYIVGVDIFVLDYVYRDAKKEKERCDKARILIDMADEICCKNIEKQMVIQCISSLEQMCGIKIPPSLDIRIPACNTEEIKRKLRVFLYEKAEILFAQCPENEADNLTRMMPNGIYYQNFYLPKEYYEKLIELPFENTQMPVPLDYDSMLTKRYGDYMKIVKNVAGHDYPFYDTQKKSLDVILKKAGITYLEGYVYCTEEAEKYRQKTMNTASIREYSVEYLNAIELYLEKLYYITEVQEGQAILADSQQLAIDFGNLIEACKGEGTKTVAELTTFCEKIFHLYEYLGQRITSEDVGTCETIRMMHCTEWSSMCDELKGLFHDISMCVKEEVLERKIALFIPYQWSKWSSMEELYSKCREKGMEVQIMPISYEYKRFDGSVIETVYEGETFAEYFPILKDQEIDLKLLGVNEIYFQAPWDDYNPVLRVNQNFFTEKLSDAAEKIIYVSPYRLDDFEDKHVCEYKNLRDYCVMPGVIYADKIYVNSEQIKRVYVQKLMEACEGIQKQELEHKIEVLQWKDKVEFDAVLPEDLKQWRKQNEGKMILYYGITFAGWRKNPEQMLQKVENSLRMFEAYKDKVAVIMSEQQEIEQYCRKYDENLWQRICAMLENRAVSLYVEREKNNYSELICAAYYGDISIKSHRYRMMEKPVLIQDMNL